LFLSNLISGKGFEDFAAVAEILAPSYPGLRWVAAGGGVGDGQFERLRDAWHTRVPELKLAGQVGAAQKEELFGRSMLLAFPSTYKYEAQPLVIIEALGHGLPVVAYDTGGVRDLISDAGRLVNSGNIGALAAAVNELLSDGALRSELSAKSYATWRDRNSMEAFTIAWGDTLEGLQC
jgi:glycosyltransferase involved in cell wall biosynthesis